MFSFFTRSTVAATRNTLTVGSVRKLDGQFIVLTKVSADGSIAFRYEDDNTNTEYTGLADWTK